MACIWYLFSLFVCSVLHIIQRITKSYFFPHTCSASKGNGCGIKEETILNKKVFLYARENDCFYLCSSVRAEQVPLLPSACALGRQGHPAGIAALALKQDPGIYIFYLINFLIFVGNVLKCLFLSSSEMEPSYPAMLNICGLYSVW